MVTDKTFLFRHMAISVIALVSAILSAILIQVPVIGPKGQNEAIASRNQSIKICMATWCTIKLVSHLFRIPLYVFVSQFRNEYYPIEILKKRRNAFRWAEYAIEYSLLVCFSVSKVLHSQRDVSWVIYGGCNLAMINFGYLAEYTKRFQCLMHAAIFICLNLAYDLVTVATVSTGLAVSEILFVFMPYLFYITHGVMSTYEISESIKEKIQERRDASRKIAAGIAKPDGTATSVTNTVVDVEADNPGNCTRIWTNTTTFDRTEAIHDVISCLFMITLVVLSIAVSQS